MLFYTLESLRVRRGDRFNHREEGYGKEEGERENDDDDDDEEEEAVPVRPSFSKTPQNVSASAGESAVLTCRVENLGKKTVSIE